jgi:hypothetical protein
MTSDHPVTYHEASGGNIVAQEARYRELTQRDVMSAAIVTLKARGEWTEDRARVLNPDDYPPLSVNEYLEVLALGAVIARYYRHPSQVHKAVRAGATWDQIAAAAGITAEAAASAYHEWAEGQHKYAGMSDAEYAAAIERADSPDAAGKTG